MREGERRLAAIMFTDIVGYTALTQANEAQAMEVLDRHNRLLRPFFPKYHGREVKSIGDSFLVEFDSALDATNCAIDIQRYLQDYNGSSKDEWKIRLRIGVHIGDVIHQGGDVFGDAVNIASRLQPLAEPEGVCISEQVYDQVRNKIPQSLVKLEPHDLKGVKFAVDVYKVVMPWEEVEEAGGAGGLDMHRVAVMPLVNMISDPNETYFADGMTEELISAVSKVRELKVISRTSAMHYKNQSKRITEIGRELLVGAVLEGSVRKAGNRVRIAVQLIDASNDQHLWAENYDRTLEDVFTIQSDIASRVAGELKIQLVDSERERLTEKSTGNSEAYTLFLRGRELGREADEQATRQAMSLFDRALQLDSSFAKAYTELALCHLYLGNVGYEPYQESVDRGAELLDRAIELDPNLAEAHAGLAQVLFNKDDLVGSEEEARRAIELNPSLPEGYEQMSNVIAMKEAVAGKNGEETVKLIETYYHLDPMRPAYIADLLGTYLRIGREKEGLEHLKKTELLAPLGTYRVMTEYHLSKNDFTKAMESHSMAEKLDPNNPWTTWMKGFIAGRMGNRDLALAAIKRLEESKMGATSLGYVGFVYYSLGDFDSSFDYMNRSMDQHALVVGYPMYSPLFAGLRADPRYQMMLEKAKRMFWSEGSQAGTTSR